MDLDKYIRKSEKAGPSFALRNKGKPPAEEKPRWQEKNFNIEKRCLQCGKIVTREDTLLYPRFCCETCKERYLSGAGSIRAPQY